jgi:hypothetical protein
MVHWLDIGNNSLNSIIFKLYPLRKTPRHKLVIESTNILMIDPKLAGFLLQFRQPPKQTIENKPYLCPKRMCSKRTSNMAALKNHYVSHFVDPEFARQEWNSKKNSITKTCRKGLVLNKESKVKKERLNPNEARRKNAQSTSTRRTYTLQRKLYLIKQYRKSKLQGKSKQFLRKCDDKGKYDVSIRRVQEWAAKESELKKLFQKQEKNARNKPRKNSKKNKAQKTIKKRKISK